jgi:putative aldouronate transport system permease protein
MLYINNSKLYPLQYLLYNMLSAQEAMTRISQISGVVVYNLPIMSLKMAMAVVATGPILLVYPFVQKFFIRGITVGAVKG